jgi:hypothetical protein
MRDAITWTMRAVMMAVLTAYEYALQQDNELIDGV